VAVDVVPAADAGDDLFVEVLSVFFELAHEGLGGGVVDVEGFCGLSGAGGTSLISTESKITRLISRILSRWVILLYLSCPVSRNLF
jgi:hypothetical protein